MTLAHDTGTPLAEVLGWSVETIAWAERANVARSGKERWALVQAFSAAHGNREALVEIVADAFGVATATALDIKLQFGEKD